MSDVLTIRPFREKGEYRECSRLQKDVWGYADEDVIPASQLLTSQQYGGILLGAFDPDGRLEGFVYSFPGSYEGEWIQYSRMLGVRPGERNRGLGARLKATQARAALDGGFRRMHWTFDPLERLNSHFNLGKLGVGVAKYYVDLYGASSSALHRGLPTDRFLADWDLEHALASGRLEKLLRGESVPPAWTPRDRETEGAALARGDADPAPGPVDRNRSEDVVSVEIPWDVQGMKQSSIATALLWRERTREAILHYWERGYRIAGFRSLPEEGGTGRAFHLLRRGAGS